MNNDKIVNKLNFIDADIQRGPHYIFTFTKNIFVKNIIKMKPELMELMFNVIGNNNTDGILIKSTKYNTYNYDGINMMIINIYLLLIIQVCCLNIIVL